MWEKTFIHTIVCSALNVMRKWEISIWSGSFFLHFNCECRVWVCILMQGLKSHRIPSNPSPHRGWILVKHLNSGLFSRWRGFSTEFKYSMNKPIIWVSFSLWHFKTKENKSYKYICYVNPGTKLTLIWIYICNIV